ncbi:hypothetical protein [Geoalkalibacter halelectricus]|uniref:hypothetical protein n=1 Tax=Geoalkalibacter halelectricus TaxID=2847045 RepID=UPI0026705B09|nr:hypothetical protein [Geoalkalibacter halelectricus]MDO3380485.1 hypothetical protein [Geoalkalibacter halelectricus]
MKYLLCIAGVVLAFLLLRQLRRMRRAQPRKSSPEIYSMRVFKEGADPFDPNERIEIYYRKKD